VAGATLGCREDGIVRPVRGHDGFRDAGKHDEAVTTIAMDAGAELEAD